jgi:hypothetical protein
MTQSFSEYLLQEIRCAALRAGLAREDIIAVGTALKDGTINADQALDILQDYDCMSYIQPKPPAKKVAS